MLRIWLIVPYKMRHFRKYYMVPVNLRLHFETNYLEFKKKKPISNVLFKSKILIFKLAIVRG